MIEEPEIFRAAVLLIDQHGEDAGLRATQRADELLKDGDVDGSAVWRRILAAVKELWRGRRGQTRQLKRPLLPGPSCHLSKIRQQRLPVNRTIRRYSAEHGRLPWRRSRLRIWST